jgi:2-succinyl-6-hydroxy-2,4-cyclohexadiene-1-carboxylate synthase
LHGFLGAPTDFDGFKQALESTGPARSETSLQLTTVDLYDRGPLDATHPFVHWTRNFCRSIAKRPHKPWLLGYSLGGRLALSVATLEPQAIAGAILVSTHPGLHHPTEVAQRSKWEQQWAEVFKQKTPAEAFAMWNQQEVFRGTAPKTSVRALATEEIIASLLTWSNTRHPFTWADLRNSSARTHWVVGEQDPKFVQLMSDLWGSDPKLETEKVTVLQDAGHRVHLDAPLSLARTVVRFIFAQRQREGVL